MHSFRFWKGLVNRQSTKTLTFPKYFFVKRNTTRNFNSKLLCVKLCRFSTHIRSYSEAMASNLYLTNYACSEEAEKIKLRIENDIQTSLRVKKSLVLQLLLAIERKEYFPQDNETTLLLLRCCGKLMPSEKPTFRVQLAKRIWANLQETGAAINIDLYNALLKCYLENRHPVSPDEILSLTKHHDPNETTYQLLLECSCEIGNIAQISEIISTMKEKGIPATRAVFNALLLGHARAGNLKYSYEIFEIMKSAQILPTAETYTALLKGLAESNEFHEMKKIFDTISSSNIILNESQYLEILKSCALSGQTDLLQKVISLIPQKYVDLTPEMYNLIVHLVNIEYEAAAFVLLNSIPLESPFISSEERKTFGTFFIEEMLKTQTPIQNVINICNDLIFSGKNVYALFKAAEITLIEMQIENSIELFRTLKNQKHNLRPHYFWPLFIAASRRDGEKGILGILEYMQELGVQCDQDSLVDYVIPYISLSEPVGAVRKLQDRGFSVSELLNPFLVNLFKCKDLNGSLLLCETFKFTPETLKLLKCLAITCMSTNDLTLIVKVLKAIIRKCPTTNDWSGQFIINILTSRRKGVDEKFFLHLLKNFEKEKLTCSPFAIDYLNTYLEQNFDRNQDVEEIKCIAYKLIDTEVYLDKQESSVPHPREMNVEQLEGHLIELKSKDMNTRGVLRRLLQQYCRSKNVGKALSVKRELEELNCEFSPGMLASLFDLFVQQCELEQAMIIWADLQKKFPYFNIDEHKVIDFATLLIKEDKQDDAINILKRRAQSAKVKGGKGVVKNCRLLLEAVAEKGTADDVREMLDFLIQSKYCEVSNVLLGPLVQAPLNRGDIVTAVDEYKRCVRKYRKTPMQYTLLLSLTKMVNNHATKSLLQEAIDATQTVHGVTNTQVNFAICLAESGHIQQLERHVKDVNFARMSSQLYGKCKRLADEDKLEALQNVLTACKRGPFCNLSSIYTLILQVYSRRGDCDGALALWTSMQETNTLPQPKFMKILADLLQKHNRDIPFVLSTENYNQCVSETVVNHK